MPKKTNLIVIVGPTASGKSELAVRLAKRFNGEIISADSRQIYRGLDIGTAKVPGERSTWKRSFQLGSFASKLAKSVFIYKGIPHYCIDFVPPRKIYTVAEYKKCAEEAIRDITARRKIPILVGGAGFWIDAVVYNLAFPPAPPNPRLRKQLEKKSPVELLAILKNLDPARAKTIEQKNPRRLIRAIEIAKAIGSTPALRKRPAYRALWIGLNPSYEAQPRKVAERAREMIRRGILGETKKLLASGISKKRIREFGFEYCLILNVLENRLPRTALPDALTRATLAYARRQMVWWKHNRQIRWITSSQNAKRLISKFLRQKEKIKTQKSKMQGKSKKL